MLYSPVPKECLRIKIFTLQCSERKSKLILIKLRTLCLVLKKKSSKNIFDTPLISMEFFYITGGLALIAE